MIPGHGSEDFSGIRARTTEPTFILISHTIRYVHLKYGWRPSHIYMRRWVASTSQRIMHQASLSQHCPDRSLSIAAHDSWISSSFPCLFLAVLPGSLRLPPQRAGSESARCEGNLEYRILVCWRNGRAHTYIIEANFLLDLTTSLGIAPPFSDGLMLDESLEFVVGSRCCYRLDHDLDNDHFPLVQA